MKIVLLTLAGGRCSKDIMYSLEKGFTVVKLYLCPVNADLQAARPQYSIA